MHRIALRAAGHLARGRMLPHPSRGHRDQPRRLSRATGRVSDRRRRRMADHRSPTAATRSAIARSVNVCGPDLPALDLLPRARRRHRRAGPRPHGVGRREGRPVPIARGVDQNPAAAIGLAELLRQVLGIARDQHAADRVREAAPPRRSRPCRRAARRCESPSSRMSSPSWAAPSSSSRSRRPSAAARRMSGRVFGGVEVEHADVGLIQVRRARRPHVRRDAVLVRQPEQRARVGDERMMHGPALLRHLDAPKPRGIALRHVLLQEPLLVDARPESAPSSPGAAGCAAASPARSPRSRRPARPW